MYSETPRKITLIAFEVNYHKNNAPIKMNQNLPNCYMITKNGLKYYGNNKHDFYNNCKNNGDNGNNDDYNSNSSSSK